MLYQRDQERDKERDQESSTHGGNRKMKPFTTIAILFFAVMLWRESRGSR